MIRKYFSWEMGVENYKKWFRSIRKVGTAHKVRVQMSLRRTKMRRSGTTEKLTFPTHFPWFVQEHWCA